MTVMDSPALTARDRAIGRMLLDGHTVREIAEQLLVNTADVRTGKRRLGQKLGIRTRKELKLYRDLLED